jgi:hypothetical protein
METGILATTKICRRNQQHTVGPLWSWNRRCVNLLGLSNSVFRSFLSDLRRQLLAITNAMRCSANTGNGTDIKVSNSPSIRCRHLRGVSRDTSTNMNFPRARREGSIPIAKGATTCRGFLCIAPPDERGGINCPSPVPLDLATVLVGPRGIPVAGPWRSRLIN